MDTMDLLRLTGARVFAEDQKRPLGRSCGQAEGGGKFFLYVDEDTLEFSLDKLRIEPAELAIHVTDGKVGCWIQRPPRL